MIYESARRENVFNCMPMGDSLTSGVGSTSTGGYRATLIQTVKSRMGAGVLVNFVGSTYVNLLNQGICGTSGLTVSEINATPYAVIQVAQYQPQVIFLHAGTNDCTQLNTGGSPTLATSRANMTTLLDNIRASAPRCIVFLALIIDNQTAHTEVVAYNSAINTDTIARADYLTGLVKIVDMYTAVGLYSATNYSDGSHLNQVGYQSLMAPAWQTSFNTVF